jgi:putative transposase
MYNDPPENVIKTALSVGIDFGLKMFLTLSTGEKIDSPKFHKQSLKEEAKVHRRIHKAKKGSYLRNKHKKSLAKIRRKTSNRRMNFNHKISRKIVNNFDVICVENIDLTKMTSDVKNINRTYRDVAFGQFREFLTYKAENAGKILVKVNPQNTTKECYNCGKLVDKTLKDRVHQCECGYIEDRDINAAKNILRRGLASLG